MNGIGRILRRGVALAILLFAASCNERPVGSRVSTPETVALRVVDETGAPVPGAEVLAPKRRNASTWLRYLPDADDVIEIPLLPGATARITARGRRAARYRTGDPEEIVLGPGLPVTFELPPDLELPRPPYRLAVRLTVDDEDLQEDLDLAAAYVDRDEFLWDVAPCYRFPEESRTLDLLLPLPGRITVNVLVLVESEPTEGTHFETSRPVGGKDDRVEIDVADTDAGQRFALPLHQADLDAAARIHGGK